MFTLQIYYFSENITRNMMSMVCAFTNKTILYDLFDNYTIKKPCFWMKKMEWCWTF